MCYSPSYILQLHIRLGWVFIYLGGGCGTQYAVPVSFTTILISLSNNQGIIKFSSFLSLLLRLDAHPHINNELMYLTRNRRKTTGHLKRNALVIMPHVSGRSCCIQYVVPGPGFAYICIFNLLLSVPPHVSVSYMTCKKPSSVRSITSHRSMMLRLYG